MTIGEKHITFFICAMSSGGAERQVTILSDLLVQRGYDVAITTFGDIEDHYKMNHNIKRVRLAEGQSKFVKLLAIFWYFLTLKTDVVISFGQRESLLSLIPLCFRKIKVIASERSFSIGKRSVREKVLHKFLYKRANSIVPNSYSQANYILQCESALKDKITTITNYTDLCYFKAIQLPHNEVVRIGVFGRYNIVKNYERLICMVYILKQQNQYKFQIECYGNHRLKDDVWNVKYLEYQKLIDELEVGDIIHLNDHVQNIVELMPTFDAICLPSLREGWSNSISEAICCGKPMLVSDISDNKYMVHDGENGFLFNPESIDDMVTAYNKFFSLDAEQRERMGIKSREIAERLFNREEFVSKYIKIIEG